MCKLLIMTGIQDGPLARDFMKLMAKPMSMSNRDGIGYTAVKPNGDIFSQRWHNNDSFFNLDAVMTPEISKKLQKYKDRLPKGALELNYSQHGEIDFTDIRTVTMHTRFATCGREFANTHPFIYNDFSLIHNGTIRNADLLNVNKISTCDSEAALQTYIEANVINDPSKAKSWLDRLTGSWAFGILGRNEHGNRILDVVRGTSSLYYLEVPGLGKVFATSDDDVMGVLKEMNIEPGTKPSMVTWDSMYRFDALTGEVLETPDIKPKYSYPSTNYYQGGRTTGTSGGHSHYGYSSHQRQNNPSRLSQKDLEYQAALMADAMGRTEFPDVLNHLGEWDYRKLKKYYTDCKEPLLDRLDLWDEAFNDTSATDYESLPEDLKEYIRDTDRTEGFKEARRLIRTLAETKGGMLG